MLKLRFLVAGLLALFALPALAASVVWQTAPTQIRTATGTVAAGAKALFYEAGTTTDFVVYTDNAQTVPHAQPVVADSNGVFPTVYVPYTASGYRTRITTAANVVITDIDGIANPAPPSGGGGGGITVATEQVFQPGDGKWRCQAGTHTGFVRANGRTIGNATSGGSERANADTATLYDFLWTNCANAQCPVSTGRGGSAAADFAANKTIQLPDARGRSLSMFDDGGNTAANVSQVSPTITTNGTTTATVSSATGVVIGMTIVSANIVVGTTVTAVVGTTITLSQAASGSAAGTAARFSLIGDAQVAMAVGGSPSQTLATAELASHTHNGTTNNEGQTHTHNTTFSTAGATTGGNFNALVDDGGATTTTSATQSANHTHTFTSDAAGGGRPHGVLSPVMVCGFYLKI